MKNSKSYIWCESCLYCWSRAWPIYAAFTDSRRHQLRRIAPRILVLLLRLEDQVGLDGDVALDEIRDLTLDRLVSL